MPSAEWLEEGGLLKTENREIDNLKFSICRFDNFKMTDGR